MTHRDFNTLGLVINQLVDNTLLFDSCLEI